MSQQLIKAARDGSLSRFNELITGGNYAADYNDALYVAICNGQIEIVKILIELSANCNDGNPLTCAVQYGQIEIVCLLINSGANVNAVHQEAMYYAIEEGYLEILNKLIEAGNDINAYEDCAIRKAVYHDHIDIVKRLIELGANIPDKAMEIAIGKRNSEIVSILIDAGYVVTDELIDKTKNEKMKDLLRQGQRRSIKPAKVMR